MSWLRIWEIDCCQELWIANSFWEKEKRASKFFFLRIFTETTKDQPRLALIFTFVVVSENLTVTKFQFVANKFHSYLVVVVLLNLNFKSFKLLWYHLSRRFRTLLLKSYIYWKFTMVLISLDQSIQKNGSAHQVIASTVLQAGRGIE